MLLEHALHAAIDGARITHKDAQGVYVEHSLSKGFLRCWPVDRAEDEPDRTQCLFVRHADDEAADWYEIEQPVSAIDYSDRDAALLRSIGEVIAASPDLGKFAPKRDDSAALASIGFVIPGAVPAIDVDALHIPTGAAPGAWGPMPSPVEPVPARDAWGKPKT